MLVKSNASQGDSHNVNNLGGRYGYFDLGFASISLCVQATSLGLATIPLSAHIAKFLVNLVMEVEAGE